MDWTGRAVLVFLIMMLGVGCTHGLIAKNLDLDQQSVVIGRLAGYVLKEKGELYETHGYVSDALILGGWELKSTDSEAITKLSLNKQGYFAAVVAPGNYVFRQNRKGASNYKVKPEVILNEFKVGRGMLVNLGTYEISVTNTMGTLISDFLVMWSIERRQDSDSSADTIEWFYKVNPGLEETFRYRETRPVEKALPNET